MIKIVTYNQDEDYPYTQLAINNPTRPENVDIYMIQLLTKLVYAGYTPHINLSALAFRCNRYNQNILRMCLMPEKPEEYALLSEEEKKDRYIIYDTYVNGRPIERSDNVLVKKYYQLLDEIKANKTEIKGLEQVKDAISKKIYELYPGEEEETPESNEEKEKRESAEAKLEKERLRSGR